MKGLKLSFWQIGILKGTAFSFAALLTLNFPGIISIFQPIFWIVMIVGGIYILNLWIKQ